MYLTLKYGDQIFVFDLYYVSYHRLILLYALQQHNFMAENINRFGTELAQEKI